MAVTVSFECFDCFDSKFLWSPAETLIKYNKPSWQCSSPNLPCFIYYDIGLCSSQNFPTQDTKADFETNSSVLLVRYNCFSRSDEYRKFPSSRFPCSVLSPSRPANRILRDPGAASRDDAIFSGENLLQEHQFQKCSNSVPLISQKKYFSGQSAGSSSRA